MSRDEVRVAFVGCGALANRVHYPSLASIEDAQLVACCDLVPERRQETSRRFEIPGVYADYREMVEEEAPDAVYVVMPPHHLFDIVVWCLEAGRDVFIEKPPGVTTSQTLELANWASRNDCVTMVGFNRRFIPLLRRTRDLQLEAGELDLAVSTFYKDNPHALYYDGAIDALHCDAIHAVDALRWMGGEVVAVASHVSASAGRRANRWVAVVEFESGATGVLLANWASGARVHTFELHAPGFAAFVDPDQGGEAEVYSGNQEPMVIGSGEAAGSDEWHRIYGFYDENRHFVECVKRGRQPACNFEDAARSMRLADEILRDSL